MESWGEKTIRFEDLFEHMEEWLIQQVNDDQRVHVIGVGTITTRTLRNWIRCLNILGRRLMNYGRGLAIMQGQVEPTMDNFLQACLLIETGRFIEFLGPNKNVSNPEEENPDNWK